MSNPFSEANIRKYSLLGTSAILGQVAPILIARNEKVIFVSADLVMFSGMERVSKMFPNKIINVGIAEQNMIGVAAGLSSEGFIPISSTYASFLTTRALDQIRLAYGYMNLKGVLVGVASGLSVGILGPTHMAIEDISVINSVPNFTILSPCDTTESLKCILSATMVEGPVYVRLTGGQSLPLVYDKDYDFVVGKTYLLRDGKDLTIFATGAVVANTLIAAEILSQHGYEAKVVNVPTLKPLSSDEVLMHLNKKLVFTIEEHSVIGGLGSIISNLLINHRFSGQLTKIGINDYYEHAASYDFLIEQYGLSANKISERILNVIRGKQ